MLRLRIALLALIALALLSCADNPTAPDTLTESEIEALIDARVAEEIAKMNGNHEDVLTPQEIAETAFRSLVLVRIKTPRKYKSTGFVVGKDLVATTYHSISGLKTGIVERIEPDQTHAINSIAAVDIDNDLAILHVAGLNAPPLICGDSSTVVIGDTVYVAGNPLSYRNTFSSGIASGFEASSLVVKNQVLQITAPVSPGSSGSAVFNSDGEVVGIMSSVDVDGQNLNFAIPVNHLKSLLSTIR